MKCPYCGFEIEESSQIQLAQLETRLVQLEANQAIHEAHDETVNVLLATAIADVAEQTAELEEELEAEPIIEETPIEEEALEEEEEESDAQTEPNELEPGGTGEETPGGSDVLPAQESAGTEDNPVFIRVQPEPEPRTTRFSWKRGRGGK